MKIGIACDDGVASYHVDGKFVEFVSSRPSASAYEVSNVNRQITENKSKPRYLE